MALPGRGILLVVLVSVFWALATISVMVRVWSRWIKRQPMMFNDYAIFGALLFTAGIAISNIIAVAQGGIGSHLLETTHDQQIASQKIYTEVWILQVVANTFVRLSFLDLLRRIFKVRAFVNAVWVVMGLSIAYFVGCFITFFALCRPFAYNWDITIKDGECGDRYLPFLLSAIFNLLLDFAIILLPLPVLWRLQLKTGKKIALTAVFGVGIVVCVMTILRTVAVVDFNPPSAKKDFTYTVFYDALWSSLEPSLGVVNACLPLFPPVMQSVGASPFFSRLKSMLTNTGAVSSSGKASYKLGSASEWSSNHHNNQAWSKLKESNASGNQSIDTMPLTSIQASNLGSGKRATVPNVPYDIEISHTIEVREDMTRGPDRV
ncbi:hypothetical protein PISL3812_09133 [Talaromyces islandicus]|uniref:Rhodopsin domain-containing protein n=1 Tax=Talaromyces islandicus TaxID=28573 RepID=A0A0U1M944_TALIS|nr:hypothetical protein PISL3812_09133 [Talaromyces islandicus]